MFRDDIEFKAGDKVLFDIKFWSREIAECLGDIEIDGATPFEISSAEGELVLIKELNKKVKKRFVNLACEICHNKETFKKGSYRICLSCARSERNRLYGDLVSILNEEQMEVFLKYEKASNLFSSMMILD